MIATLPADVCLRRVRLDVDAAALDGLMQWLDPAERARAARLRGAATARRFIARRGALRVCLAEHWRCAPAPGLVVFDAAGRPQPRHPREQGWAVSTSHRGDVAVIALVRARAVGVDIEALDPELEVDAVAPFVLAAGELARLPAGPPAARRLAFCRAWTRKEAWLKACGRGLGPRPSELDASRALADARRWAAWPLRAGTGLVGTLVLAN